MDQGSNKPAHDILQCPPCSGRGELPVKELFDLREKDFSRKVEALGARRSAQIALGR